jgi:uncharacterized circularly permuted ATP-grasp superfamily protein/uncharacterized alpha-E superfamily protein
MSSLTSSPLQDELSPRPLSMNTYLPNPGVFDELVGPEGQIRPHWQDLLTHFGSLTEPEVRHARETAARILHENGVTYLAQDGSQQSGRPWQLDLFPLLIDPIEWKFLEQGLIQRAHVLNNVLVDLYGLQRLIKEKKIPAALVYGNPQFLPACHGNPVQHGTHLHFLAFDLARSPSGQWWVLRDKAEAPSGIGYALENRLVVSRSMPSLLTQHAIQPLSSFFQSFSEDFLHLSSRDDPRAVVLAPGPQHAVYFEHAYLARFLGYPLVEGSDLTVRDDRLFLKTVEGLQPIDLVLRRIHSDFCDPLELKTNSALGVPGLLQAVHAGHVTMANALGSGLVESESLLSFLPGLSKSLIGEDLKIPSVATWWCGQEKERQYVLDNLDRLLIRKVLAQNEGMVPQRISFIGPDLSKEELNQLREAIHRKGFQFVGREIVSPSTTPFWSEQHKFTSVPMTLRVYLTATANGYRVMPGGLARVSVKSDPRGHWHEPGDFSKDVWVLRTDSLEKPSVVVQPHLAVQLKRGGRDLPSRTADNVFWFGRYVERAEGAVRLLRSLVSRLSGEAGLSPDSEIVRRLISLLLFKEQVSQRKAKRALEGGPQVVKRELWALLFDSDSQDGLSQVLGNVHRTAELLRHRLSLDTWQILMELSTIPQTWSQQHGQSLDEALRLLSRMVHHLAALNGMILENMTRSYAWRFLDMGRRLERMRDTTKLIRHLSTRGNSETTEALSLLLELADGSLTYRTRYRSEPNLASVMDLLLIDDTNPRSVLFQLLNVEEHLHALPRDASQATLPPAERLVTRLIADLRLADVMVLAQSHKSGVRGGLDRTVRNLESGVHELSDIVALTYFSHAMPQQISGPHWLEAMS